MRQAANGAATIVGLVSLAACAQTPRLDIAKTGTLPPASSSFAMVEGADTPASAALTDCLSRHGVGLSTRPAYLAQVSETDRPASVGALQPQPDGTKDKPQWLPGGVPARRPVRSLAFSLIQAATGREVYRIIVSEQYSPGSKKSGADLAKTACANLADPA